ncbi:MAG TPA: 3',5'-nucleoside bisphosphate phosphatase [Burkholderiales bacterium]|nr:3',5'-nucleoside bisphosphate phosphatase [Burkholderiales bacterium]
MLDVDLHSHSTHSDGLLAPADVVKRAFEHGVKLYALTDHDELSGLAEARAQAEACGMRFVAGVEISVSWREETLHIVGLNIDPEHADLAEGLRKVRAGRHVRAERIAADLERAGIAGALEGARRYARNPDLISRAHFARYMVERGLVKDTNTAFRRYLTAGKPGYVAHQWAELAQAVHWINASGGAAVIAHPGRYKLNNRQNETLLGEFRDLGGAGVEVVTGSHTVDQYATWARYAQRFGLKASAGSDFHGPDESYLDLGRLPDLPFGLTPVWTAF